MKFGYILAFALAMSLTPQAKAQVMIDDQTPCAAAIGVSRQGKDAAGVDIHRRRLWASRSAPSGKRNKADESRPRPEIQSAVVGGVIRQVG